jgi:tetratricopeptide (TPR) repeat protein
VLGVLSCSKPATDRSPPPPSSAGEAPRLVFKDSQGRILTDKDLEGYSGTAHWEVIGAGNIPAEAKGLHDQGRRAGAAGDYDRAHALFAQAQKLAPSWPYPSYDDGYTYLLQGKVQEAEAAYTITSRLAPRGFFTVRTALDALQRERAGALPKGTYLRFLSLEWKDDPAEQQRILDGLVRDAPGFAPVWKEVAQRTEDESQKLAALDRGLEAHPDSETLGILTANKAIILDHRGRHDEAVRLLAELALDPTSSLGTEFIAKATLASLTRQR